MWRRFLLSRMQRDEELRTVFRDLTWFSALVADQLIQIA